MFKFRIPKKYSCANLAVQLNLLHKCTWPTYGLFEEIT